MVVGVSTRKVGTGGSGVQASAALWILDQPGLHKTLPKKRKKKAKIGKRMLGPPCFLSSDSALNNVTSELLRKDNSRYLA